MRKKLIERFDYLWKGDKDTLTTMWLSIVLAFVSILLAIGSVLELVLNIYD